ncbi:MAG: hypothetical protein M1570_09015 [Chloroflexi bacterium]|nr:hypothetical protein [Chloroflexota bacterium]
MAESPIPSFDKLSFEEAIRILKGWGFQVEPGPRPEEVSLITKAEDHCTFSVHPAEMLTSVVAAALRVRWQNGILFGSIWWAGVGVDRENVSRGSWDHARLH